MEMLFALVLAALTVIPMWRLCAAGRDRAAVVARLPRAAGPADLALGPRVPPAGDGVI